MSGNWTPGPWSYARNPEGTRWIIDSAPARAIACTAGYEPDNKANARLIAAAPELVEALREAIEWDGRDEHGVDAVWLWRAEALLARIEGKSA